MGWIVDIDDTTTPHLAVVAINALAQAKESRTWIPLAERKPTAEDETYHDTTGAPCFICLRKSGGAPIKQAGLWEDWIKDITHWLPLPKHPPPAVDPDEAAFEKFKRNYEQTYGHEFSDRIKQIWQAALAHARQKENQSLGS